MTDYCVAWNREANRLVMLTPEDLVNLNASSFLTDQPALAVIRMHCTEEDARRYIKAYARLMAERSLIRLEAKGVSA